MIMAMNATATITTRPIHTLTSHILHNMHNQGIFIESLVSLQQLSTSVTLLPQALLVSIPAISDNYIDTIDILYVYSFFFYRLDVVLNTCRPLFVDNIDFIHFMEHCFS